MRLGKKNPFCLKRSFVHDKVEAKATATSDEPGLLVPLGVLGSEDVHRAVVAGHADEGGILVEINAAE